MQRLTQVRDAVCFHEAMGVVPVGDDLDDLPVDHGGILWYEYEEDRLL
jgi:hypothetical protein